MSKGVKEFWQQNKKVMLMYVVALGILLLGFVLCRYAFFGLHGMKEWPAVLLWIGLATLLISLLAGKQFVPWFTAIGYVVGFFIGVLFHTEGTDPGGGKTDNLWIIWTIVFLGCILAGFLCEIWMKWRRVLKK